MKINRPAAREIVPSKSDCSGQGGMRRLLNITLLNRSWAKIRKSEVVSLSAVKSYRICVDGLRTCDKTQDEPSQVTDRGHGEWS